MNSHQSRSTTPIDSTSSELPEQDRQMPLGLMGEVSDLSDLGSGSGGGGRKLSSGSIVLAIVVVVAIAGLFSMRTIGKVTGAASGSSQIEDSINDFLTKITGGKAIEPGTDVRQLVVGDGNLDIGNIGDDYTEHQVALADVQKNPFLHPNDSGTTTPAMISSGSDPVAVRRAELAALFQSVGNRLRLKSVILGAEPLANVSGRIVRLNETVLIEPEKVEFLVAAIENESITLKGINKELELEVEITLQINRRE